jgi:hypothetical protein
MIRLKRIMVLCLAALFLVNLTVYAALAPDSFTYKVSQDGTVMSIQTWECFLNTNNQKSVQHNVRLKDSSGRVIYSRDAHTYDGTGTREGTYKYYAYFPYRINMVKCNPGKYTLVINCWTKYGVSAQRVIPFTYGGAPVLKFSSTKVIRNNNGDVVQRFSFSRANVSGKMFHAQIFNSRNQLVRSFNFSAGNSNQPISFSWNGWPGGNSAIRCPKGVYTVKYWIDGLSPRTANFTLAL